MVHFYTIFLVEAPELSPSEPRGDVVSSFLPISSASFVVIKTLFYDLNASNLDCLPPLLVYVGPAPATFCARSSILAFLTSITNYLFLISLSNSSSMFLIYRSTL